MNDTFLVCVRLTDELEYRVEFDEADHMKARAAVIKHMIDGRITGQQCDSIIDAMDGSVMRVRLMREVA